MRWRYLVALLMTLAIATGVVRGLPPSAQAQDATPPAEQQAAAPDAATFRALAAGSIEVLEPSTANLVLGRVSLSPGATVPFDPMDPSALLVYASSGALTFSVEVPMTVARGGEAGTPVPPEEVPANTEFTLSDGDSALFPGSIAGEVRNDGGEEATAWVVNIVHLTDAAATPTP